MFIKSFGVGSTDANHTTNIGLEV